jgi:uncharacterized protein
MQDTAKDQIPYLGYGLGLHPDHSLDILSQRPNVDWFEALTENYLVPGGKPLHFLYRIRRHYPMALHGVSLSIGSTDALNIEYIRQVKALAERVDAAWISDDLCWTGVKGINLHDLSRSPIQRRRYITSANASCRCRTFSAARSCWKMSRATLPIMCRN